MRRSDRRYVTVGELIDSKAASLQTGPFGSQLHASDYVPNGISVIPTEAIGRRSIVAGILPQVSESTVARLSRHVLRPGDILFARRGIQATGLSAIVTERHAGALCSTGAILLRLSSADLDPEFLSFWLSTPRSIEWIKAHAVGGVMPNVNESVLRLLPIEFPDIGEQLAISTFLSAIDEKIALNSDVNRKLEQLANALFRSWFADFDPVTAQRDGRTPIAVPAEAVNLFASHFEESELGPIPQGWRPSTIGAEVTVVGGSTPSTNEPRFWNGDVCWVTPRDLSRLDDLVVLDTERHITQEGLGQISSGLLPVGTVLLSSRAPIGYIAIAEVPVAVNQGFIAMKCDKQLSSHFAVNWVLENLNEVLARAGGTTFAEISKTAFRPIPLVVPPPEVLDVFDAIVAPCHAMRVANVRESRTLAELRDTLLGPLLSGELTIKSAEKAVGTAL